MLTIEGMRDGGSDTESEREYTDRVSELGVDLCCCLASLTEQKAVFSSNLLILLGDVLCSEMQIESI